MKKATDKFLRDMERVSTLGSLLFGRNDPQEPPTFREIRPGVFVSTELEREDEARRRPNPIEQLRQKLRQADSMASDLGRTIQEKIR